ASRPRRVSSTNQAGRCAPSFYCQIAPEVKSAMAGGEHGQEDVGRIFVLADTHNRLPQALSEMAKSADEIWHLGDVCAESILDELRAVGPRLTVVRGNCDSNPNWPLVLDLVRGGLKLRLQH